jgi:hypothetical protein
MELLKDQQMRGVPSPLKPVPGAAQPKPKCEKYWTLPADAISYRGDVVTHAGGTWQAQRDTAKEPPHPDWIQLAVPGRDGRDTVTPTVRGTWRADAEYRALDIVGRDGGCFIAKCDAPGVCPGPDWQIVSTRGARGERGERGPNGERGLAGPVAPTIVGWQIDRDSFTATPIMSDGSEGPPLELRGLFGQYHAETGWCRHADNDRLRILAPAHGRRPAWSLGETAHWPRSFGSDSRFRCRSKQNAVIGAIETVISLLAITIAPVAVGGAAGPGAAHCAAALAIFLMLNAVTPFITPDPPWLANLPLVVLCLLRRERRDTAPARCACFRNERVDHTQSL